MDALTRINVKIIIIRRFVYIRSFESRKKYDEKFEEGPLRG